MVLSLLCRLHCGNHSNYINRFGNIMHPHDLRPLADGKSR